MDQTKLDLLDNHNWEDTMLILSAYVIRLCRLYRYKLPLDMEPEDIAIEAFEKVYSGERKWYPEKDPNITQYMLSVVKSMVSNIKGSKQIQKAEIDEGSIGYDAHLHETIEYEELSIRIEAAVRKDTDLALIYKALKDGWRPAEISKEYALDIRIIQNAQKRLRKLVTDLIDES